MFAPRSIQEELLDSTAETRVLAVLWETLVHEFGHVVVARDGGLMPNYVQILKANYAVAAIQGIKNAAGQLEPTRLDLIARISVAGVSAESLLSTDEPDRLGIVNTLRRYRYKGDVDMLEAAIGASLDDSAPKVIRYIDEAISILRPRMLGIAQAAQDAAQQHIDRPRPLVPAPIIYRILEPEG